MDKVTSKELYEVNEANISYVNSVLNLSSQLSLDVTRPLFEKSYRKSRVVSLGSDFSATSSLPFPLPEVCSCCYTPRSANALHTQLQRCYRNARSVRHLKAKKCSVLHKLSTRERMMGDSHDQRSNLLLTRCRVCGLKTRQLCPIPGPRPAPSSHHQENKPDVLQLAVATINTVTPSRKKKKRNKNKCESGLIISDDLKLEIQMTMGVHESISMKNKKIRDSSEVLDSKDADCVSSCSNNTASKVVELDCVERSNILSNGNSILKKCQGTPKLELKNSTQLKKIETSKVLPIDADRSKLIIPPRVNVPLKSKLASKMEHKSLKQTPSAGSKVLNKSSPASKKLKGCEIATHRALKKMKSGDVSVLDQDNMAQYGVPLIRINLVKTTQNERKMQQTSNALKNAFKRAVPPERTKSIKDFPETHFDTDTI